MNYPCNVIRDLLPLYWDKVCSEESKTIIEEHLEQCPGCKAQLLRMEGPDPKMDDAIAADAAMVEYQKASSLRAVKQKLWCRQALLAALAVLALALLGGLIVHGLKHSAHIVPYENNLSVSMVDGSLMGRLYGSEYSSLKSKTVSIPLEGKTLQCIFYCVSDTSWDDLVTSKNVFSEYLLCPREKGADTVDRVYYYAGDYQGLEDLNHAELQAVVEDSTLLWKK